MVVLVAILKKVDVETYGSNGAIKQLLPVYIRYSPRYVNSHKENAEEDADVEEKQASSRTRRALHKNN